MMKQNYYLVSDGKLKREENTIYFVNEDGKRALPINRIYSIYALGSLSVTSKAISLLAKEGVCIHFFNRYGFYLGSFYPRETLISGDLVVKQVEHYLDNEKRIFLAKAFVEGSVLNMNRVLSSYKLEKELITHLQKLAEVKSVEEVMGVEAIARTEYFSNFDNILKNFKFRKRSRQPPENEVNAMMSFGNALLYSAVLSEIYHTQLHPAISYLHEPSERRFSLSLDISEIFKPIIVDRMIFYLVNKGIMKEGDFDRDLDGVLLSNSGRRKMIEEFNGRLKTTVKHRQLKRNVSYQRLIRLECYKLIKHLLGTSQYKPLVMWW
ncbi:subtype I-B CRISPR-associated endonuclease Cas1 [Archaeoglobales archaeon]|nr:MAG: subtype I-B CRISPR-associated endonuclease Cas1 [Archaeoglobales archaeon]